MTRSRKVSLAIVLGIPLALVLAGIALATWAHVRFERARAGTSRHAAARGEVTVPGTPSADSRGRAASGERRSTTPAGLARETEASPSPDGAEPSPDGAEPSPDGAEPAPDDFVEPVAVAALAPGGPLAKPRRGLGAYAASCVGLASSPPPAPPEAVALALAEMRDELLVIERELVRHGLPASLQAGGERFDEVLALAVASAADALAAAAEGDQERAELALGAARTLAPYSGNGWLPALVRHVRPRDAAPWIAWIDRQRPRAELDALLEATANTVARDTLVETDEHVVPAWMPRPLGRGLRTAMAAPGQWAAAREMAWIDDVRGRLAALPPCDEPVVAWSDPPRRRFRGGWTDHRLDFADHLVATRATEAELAFARRVLVESSGMPPPPQPSHGCADWPLEVQRTPDGLVTVAWIGEGPPAAPGQPADRRVLRFTFPARP